MFMKSLLFGPACAGCVPENGCSGCDIHSLCVEHSKALPVEHPLVDLVEYACQCDGQGDGCPECAGR